MAGHSNSKGKNSEDDAELLRKKIKGELSRSIVDEGKGSRKLTICGRDDKRNAICFNETQPEIYLKARPIARLLINGTYACTGWLASSDNILMTNQHCIKDLYDLRNSDFEFMAEEENCLSTVGIERSFSPRNFGEIYDGVEVLKVSIDWDYSLIRLSGNPSSKFG